MSSVCPSCKTDGQILEEGDCTLCVVCGHVFEESAIVNEISFGETHSGAAVALGSQVGFEQKGARIGGPGVHRATESREHSLSSTSTTVRQLARAAGCNERVADKATRYLRLAMLDANFVQGRRSEYVAAACLYLASRLDKGTTMLMDLADTLQVNVFVLGSTYLQLVEKLNLRKSKDHTPPPIDPSIYISRFAALLEFGEETHRVAADAVRLVQRMDRDWMTNGRRPAGICGAALILAARMNGFRRSVLEVVQVVKIADQTLVKRLQEFGRTASGKMTIEEFRTVWLEEEELPPSFVKNRAKEDRQAKEESQTPSQIAADDDDEDVDENLNQLIASEIEQNRERYAERQPIPAPRPSDDPPVRLRAHTRSRGPVPNESLGDLIAIRDFVKESSEPALERTSPLERPSPPPATAEKISLYSETLSDMEDFDEELDQFIMKDSEVVTKTKVWLEFNRDYLEKVAEIARNTALNPDGTSTTKPVSRKRTAKPGTKTRDRDEATKIPGKTTSALESTKRMLAKKSFSRKIDYEALGAALRPYDRPLPVQESTGAS